MNKNIVLKRFLTYYRLKNNKVAVDAFKLIHNSMTVGIKRGCLVDKKVLSESYNLLRNRDALYLSYKFSQWLVVNEQAEYSGVPMGVFINKMSEGLELMFNKDELEPCVGTSAFYSSEPMDVKVYNTCRQKMFYLLYDYIIKDLGLSKVSTDSLDTYWCLAKFVNFDPEKEYLDSIFGKTSGEMEIADKNIEPVVKESYNKFMSGGIYEE